MTQKERFWLTGTSYLNVILAVTGTLETRMKIMELMDKVGANFTGVLKGKMFRHTTMSDEERQKLIDDHYLFRY